RYRAHGPLVRTAGRPGSTGRTRTTARTPRERPFRTSKCRRPPQAHFSPHVPIGRKPTRKAEARRQTSATKTTVDLGELPRMIEKHYGALIGGAHAGIVGRLDALEARQAVAADV